MHIGHGQVLELILKDGFRHARLRCPENLVPTPGKYLLAGDRANSPLPVPVFYTDSAPNGFITAAPVPDYWNPGLELSLRGPLGRGFLLPAFARRVGLVAFEDSPSHLNGLVLPALHQEASVVLVSDLRIDSLPDEVEVQPLSAFSEIMHWADYIAIDTARESLPQLREKLLDRKQPGDPFDAQVLVRTLLACGGIAECGVCAVTVKSGWKIACKDGPVFDWDELA